MLPNLYPPKFLPMNFRLPFDYLLDLLDIKMHLTVNMSKTTINLPTHLKPGRDDDNGREK